MSESYYFAGSLIMVLVFGYCIGYWIGGTPDTTDDEQVEEEITKLERDVELMKLKIEAQELQKQLKI